MRATGNRVGRKISPSHSDTGRGRSPLTTLRPQAETGRYIKSEPDKRNWGPSGPHFLLLLSFQATTFDGKVSPHIAHLIGLLKAAHPDKSDEELSRAVTRPGEVGLIPRPQRLKCEKRYAMSKARLETL